MTGAEHTAPAGTGTSDRVLAVLLRQTVWTLDDVARDVPRLTDAKRIELANLLGDLARLIRATVASSTSASSAAASIAPTDTLTSEDGTDGCPDRPGPDESTVEVLRAELAAVLGYSDYPCSVVYSTNDVEIGVDSRDLRTLLDRAGAA